MEDGFAINLILKGELKEKFEEIKKLSGITEPNTKTLEKCIESTHKQLFS
ncbi:MAG: hypothetical protein PHE88_12535 [Elusimicrobia bacterium]|nr:hypothetical protein [Elusimicrobiota bacterium]